MSPGFGILVLCVCPFLHCCREKSFDFRLYRSSSSFPLKVLLPKVVQFSLVAQSCPTFFDPMNRSTPGLPVHHQLQKFTQTHMHWAGDAIQPSHPRSSPFPPAPNPSQRQSLFQWVSSSHEVAKVLEFLLQHQSFQWIFRTVFRYSITCFRDIST